MKTIINAKDAICHRCNYRKAFDNYSREINLGDQEGDEE